jgi:hypothetical protein
MPKILCLVAFACAVALSATGIGAAGTSGPPGNSAMTGHTVMAVTLSDGRKGQITGQGSMGNSLTIFAGGKWKAASAGAYKFTNGKSVKVLNAKGQIDPASFQWGVGHTANKTSGY